MPDLTLTERPVGALWQLSWWPSGEPAVDAALGRVGLARPGPSRSVTAGESIALDAGPGTIWVTGVGVRMDLRDDDALVTDLSHARTRLRLEGPRGEWVLSKGVALDLDAGAFPPGACATTRFGQMNVVLRRAGAQAWDIWIARGYARSLIDALEMAGGPDAVS